MISSALRSAHSNRCLVLFEFYFKIPAVVTHDVFRRSFCRCKGGPQE